jgi:hypothetical protein
VGLSKLRSLGALLSRLCCCGREGWWCAGADGGAGRFFSGGAQRVAAEYRRSGLKSDSTRWLRLWISRCSSSCAVRRRGCALSSVFERCATGGGGGGGGERAELTCGRVMAVFSWNCDVFVSELAEGKPLSPASLTLAQLLASWATLHISINSEEINFELPPAGVVLGGKGGHAEDVIKGLQRLLEIQRAPVKEDESRAHPLALERAASLLSQLLLGTTLPPPEKIIPDPDGGDTVHLQWAKKNLFIIVGPTSFEVDHIPAGAGEKTPFTVQEFDSLEVLYAELPTIIQNIGEKLRK